MVEEALPNEVPQPFVGREMHPCIDGWDILFSGVRSRAFSVLSLSLVLMEFLLMFVMSSRRHTSEGPFGFSSLLYLDCAFENATTSAFAQRPCDGYPAEGYVWELLVQILLVFSPIPVMCYINSPGSRKCLGVICFFLMVVTKISAMSWDSLRLSTMLTEVDGALSVYVYQQFIIIGYFVLFFLMAWNVWASDSDSYKYRLENLSRKHTGLLLKNPDGRTALPMIHQRICDVLTREFSAPTSTEPQCKELPTGPAVAEASSAVLPRKASHIGREKLPGCAAAAAREAVRPRSVSGSPPRTLFESLFGDDTYFGFVKSLFVRTILRHVDGSQSVMPELLPLLSLVAGLLSLAFISFLLCYYTEAVWRYLNSAYSFADTVARYQQLATDLNGQINSTVETSWNTWQSVLQVHGEAQRVFASEIHTLSSVRQAADLLRPLIDELEAQNATAAANLQQVLRALDGVAGSALVLASPALDIVLQGITGQFAIVRQQTPLVTSTISDFLSVTRWLTDIWYRLVDHLSLSFKVSSAIAFACAVIALHFNIWRVIEDRRDLRTGTKRVSANQAATIFHPVRASALPGMMMSTIAFGFTLMLVLVLAAMFGLLLLVDVISSDSDVFVNILTLLSGSGLSILVKIFVLDKFVGRRLLTDKGFITNWRLFNAYLLFTIPISTVSGILLAFTRLVYLFGVGALYIVRLDITLFPGCLSAYDSGYVTHMAALLIAKRHQNPIMQTWAQELQKTAASDISSISAARRRAIRKWNLAVTLVNNPSLMHDRRHAHKEESEAMDPKSQQTEQEHVAIRMDAKSSRMIPSSVVPSIPNMPEE
eukprot:TRINITY_DN3220_c0_g1_i2.p1 TRINITY_DN3220_c0_g1~~TRINITY_DN3220_c0_g1_i2.p1  ORF type:complete len:824 (-),score=89.53 TRINITY_DN3220_c0_g1_i2:74-2545(-)